MDLDKIGNYIKGTLNNFKASVAQGIGNWQRQAPGAVSSFGDLMNNVVNKPFERIGQEARQINASIPQNQPQIQRFFTALPQVASSVGNNLYSNPLLKAVPSYVANRVVSPALSIPGNAINAYSAAKHGDGPGVVGNTLSGVLNSAYTLGNVVNPLGTQAANLPFMGYDAIKKMVQAQNNNRRILPAALQGVTGENVPGLGNAIYKDPRSAQTLNTIEQLAMLAIPAYHGLRGFVSGEKAPITAGEQPREVNGQYGSKSQFKGQWPSDVFGRDVFNTAESGIDVPKKPNQDLVNTMVSTKKADETFKPSGLKGDKFIQDLEAETNFSNNKDVQNVGAIKGKQPNDPRLNTLSGGVFNNDPNQPKIKPSNNDIGNIRNMTQEWAANVDSKKVNAIDLNLKFKTLAKNLNISPKDEWKLVQWSELQGPKAEAFAQANGLSSELLQRAQPLIDAHRQVNDVIRNQAVKAGYDLGYIQNHILHSFNESPEKVEEVLGQLQGKGLGETPGFTQKRTTPPYADIRDRLTPRYTTFGQANAAAQFQLEKALANKSLSEKLLSSGNLIPASQAPRGFKPILSDYFPRASGGEPYYAPPKVAEYLNNIFGGKQEGPLSKTLKYTAKASGVAQDVALSGGVGPLNFYTIGQTIKDITGGLGDALSGHPVRGLKTAGAPITAMIRNFVPGMAEGFEREHMDSIKQMSSEGIPYGGSLNVEKMQPNVAKKLSIQGVGEKAVDMWNSLVNNPTFQKFLYQKKVSIFENIRDGLLNSGMDEKAAIGQAAEMLKNYEGQISTLGRDPDFQNGLKTVFMAPKYREGLLQTGKNVVKGFTTQFRNPEFDMSRRLGVGVLAMYGIYNAIQQKLTGKPMWNNPPGHEFDLAIPTENKMYYIPFMPGSTAIYRRLAGTATSLVRGDPQEAIRQASGLTSIPVSKAGELITNKDYFGRPVINPDTQNYGSVPKQAALWAAKSFAPGPVREYIQYGQDSAAYNKKVALGIKATPPNPLMSIARSIELPIKEGNLPNPQADAYFKAMDETTKSFTNPNDLAAWNLVHFQKKDAGGNVTYQKGVDSTAQAAHVYLNNPNVAVAELSMNQKLKSQGIQTNPIWDLTPQQRSFVWAAQDHLPGMPNAYSKAIYNQPWYPDYQKKLDTYFASIKQNGGGTPSGDLQAPQPSDYVKKQMDAKNWSDPQVRAYLDANTAYNNKRLEAMGLAPLAGAGGAGPSIYTLRKKINYANRKIAAKTSKGGRKIKFNFSKFKKFKSPKIKISKVKLPKLKAA